MVEGSIILPIFLFVVIALMSVIMVLNTHLSNKFLLSNACDRASVRSTLHKGVGVGSVYSEFLLHKSYTGFLTANPLAEKYDIDYLLSKKEKIFTNPFFNTGISLFNSYKAKIWNGDIEEKENDEEYVYVTRTGSVYHRSINCTYLKRSTRAIDGKEVSAQRNMDGAKYKACEICYKNKDIMENLVYITDYGTSYHRKSNCSALLREIKRIPKSKVGSRKECSKCGV